MPTPNPETWLRDALAVDRTVLANERTLLAYGRTLLALVAAGGSLIHFVTSWWAVPLGVLLLVTGISLFGFGAWRYRSVNRHLRQAKQDLGRPDGR